jgi:hypothetical protein
MAENERYNQDGRVEKYFLNITAGNPSESNYQIVARDKVARLNPALTAQPRGESAGEPAPIGRQRAPQAGSPLGFPDSWRAILPAAKP